jgi:hypothetical protein
MLKVEEIMKNNKLEGVFSLLKLNSLGMVDQFAFKGILMTEAIH